MAESIKPSEISVIVQGAISDSETKKCLQNIRKHLPGAEIILSTWEGCDVTGLDYDVLILNKDPGAVIFTDSPDDLKVFNNLNRQLLSTQEGLKKVKRKYAMKLRSDLILTSNKFLKYFDQYQARNEKFKVFERKIIVPVLYSRKFVVNHLNKEKCYIPFHVSDWFFFGLTEDLKKYFMDTKMVNEPEYSNYFKDHPENADKRFHTVSYYQYPPEQYFMLSCMQRNFADITMNDLTDVTSLNICQSEIAMVNNFIVLEHNQHGIYLNKYPISKKEKAAGFYDAYGLYFNSLYEADYKKHCDSKFKLNINDVIQSKLGIVALGYKLRSHFHNISDSRISLKNKFDESLSVIFYLIRIALASCKNICNIFSADVIDCLKK